MKPFRFTEVFSETKKESLFVGKRVAFDLSKGREG
jgi:hypothetical protein